jgi:peptidoglycan/LPS O-acetylase OafA/YrhL
MVTIGENRLTELSTKKTQYMPQLDSLRFFAVLAVMVAHNWHPSKLPGLLGALDWAGLGVRLFFVLSGFLITGILLECRNTTDSTARSPMFYVRQFYARRFLRIFPIYYLVILIALLVNLEPSREVWVWLVTYTTNIYITFHGDWVGNLGHFWTLAVEEQFYLIWPWLVLFLPRKWLIPALLFTIPLSAAYRLYAYIHFPFDIGAMDFKAGTLTIACLDSLGIGALLALFWHSNISKELLQKVLSRVVLPAGLILYTICLVLYQYGIKPSVFFVVGDFAAALIFAWLISAAGRGFNGPVGKILEFPPLLYLGKITYGIYVYHNLTPLLIMPVFNYFGIPFQVPGLLNFVLSGILTIGIASLSWHLLELPINNLKRYFQYAPKSVMGVSDAELIVEGNKS